MLCGVQLGLLRNAPWEKNIHAFFELQDEFPLKACELHLEAGVYEAAFWPWEVDGEHELIASLRGAVKKLGVHMPFMDLNPISANPRIAGASEKTLEASLRFAADAGADYVVFHARGQRVSAQDEGSDVSLWKDVVEKLAARADALDVVFCLENADDLREPQKVRDVLALCPGTVKFCLDIGHLYERVYPPSLWLKGMLLLNDRLSPSPFTLKRGLPAAAAVGWPGVVTPMLEHVYCVHVHNHDGKQAHRPLRRGKIDLWPLKEFHEAFKNIPIIVEADYREQDLQTVRGDLRYLLGLM